MLIAYLLNIYVRRFTHYYTPALGSIIMREVIIVSYSRPLVA